MGRLLIMFGAALIVIGLLVVGAERLGQGHFPGTIRFSRGSTSVWIPLGASLVASLVLTGILNLLLRLFSRP